MKNKIFKKINSGQSLFEVVMALGIMAMIIVTLVLLATLSIRNSSYSVNKSLASKYSQEMIEWLRSQRDTDWDSFYQKTTAQKWCMPTLSWTESIMNVACYPDNPVVGTNNLFREVTLSSSLVDPQNVEVDVNVYWNDSQGRHEVHTNTVFSNWRSK